MITDKKLYPIPHPARKNDRIVAIRRSAIAAFAQSLLWAH
jgi:hypothetical protein